MTKTTILICKGVYQAVTNSNNNDKRKAYINAAKRQNTNNNIAKVLSKRLAELLRHTSKLIIQSN
jgi:hypothetical protein